MQHYTMAFITINALHVSGGSSAHHQELKLYTQHRIFVELLLLLTASGKKQEKLDKYPILCTQF